MSVALSRWGRSIWRDARRPLLPFMGKGKDEGPLRRGSRTLSARADELHSEVPERAPLTLSRARERGRPAYRLISTLESALS